MNTWPPAPRRTMPVPEKQKVPALAVWSLRLSVAGAALFGLLVIIFIVRLPPLNNLHLPTWLMRRIPYLFLVCPLLSFSGLITGLIAQEQPKARLSTIVAVVGLILFTALVLLLLQPLPEPLQNR